MMAGGAASSAEAVGAASAGTAQAGPALAGAAPVGAARSVAARPRRRRQAQRHVGTAWLMLAPVVVFFSVFLIYPVGNAFWVSLTSWDLVGPQRFIGLRNYERLLEDANFLNAIRVTAVYTFGLLAIELPAALGLAILLDRKLKGRAFYQAVIFAPVVLTMVVVAMLWRVVFAPLGGLALMVTEPLGLGGLQWLNDRNLAMPALIIASLWKNVGYYMIIFLAGLQAIPATVYEAARIDGAGAWATFRRITLPLLRPFLLFVTVVSIIRTSQAFSLIYALTGGGPADATKVLPYLIYEVAFGFNRMGYASAMAVLMFFALLILTVIQFRLLRSRG
ncbi:carbohydrate ABC transporter permease [Roseomonas sp. BN140053]|uniref:carbohydrate ABC transporter permease n=1 Tax=Roseomonas sp. BN140053 TaxID=3391898 RepID=UPI0039EC6D50